MGIPEQDSHCAKGSSKGTPVSGGAAQRARGNSIVLRRSLGGARRKPGRRNYPQFAKELLLRGTRRLLAGSVQPTRVGAEVADAVLS